MDENLKDILSNLNTDVNQDALMAYLQGKLSAREKHELEKQLLDNDFAEDALEGLQAVKDETRLRGIVDGLNRDLQKKTARRKAMRDKLRIKDQPWLYITILIFLLLIVLSFLIIHRMQHSAAHP